MKQTDAGRVPTPVSSVGVFSMSTKWGLDHLDVRRIGAFWVHMLNHCMRIAICQSYF